MLFYLSILVFFVFSLLFQTSSVFDGRCRRHGSPLAHRAQQQRGGARRAVADRQVRRAAGGRTGPGGDQPGRPPRKPPWKTLLGFWPSNLHPEVIVWAPRPVLCNVEKFLTHLKKKNQFAEWIIDMHNSPKFCPDFSAVFSHQLESCWYLHFENLPLPILTDNFALV